MYFGQGLKASAAHLYPNIGRVYGFMVLVFISIFFLGSGWPVAIGSIKDSKSA